jgi:hypothetical protein
MLFFIDIAVFAFEVAIRQDMKENIGGVFRKSNGFLHFFYASEFYCFFNSSLFRLYVLKAVLG